MFYDLFRASFFGYARASLVPRKIDSASIVAVEDGYYMNAPTNGCVEGDLGGPR